MFSIIRFLRKQVKNTPHNNAYCLFRVKLKKARNMGENGRWGEDFRTILGGFAIFAVDIVRAISYNTICIVV